MDKEKYTRGFNDGYLLNKFKPNLLSKIITTSTSNDYLQGLKDAERTFKKEKLKTRTQELNNLKLSKSKNSNFDLER